VKRRGERGYALVAAVASIAAFALMALLLQTSSAGTIQIARAELVNARAQAAAEAGIALAISHLLSTDPAGRWDFDDRTRRLTFDGAAVAIRIEDEHGKVPINLAEPDQLRRLLEGVGLDGRALDVAVDSLIDWRDADEDPQPAGAEYPSYRSRGIAPRNGPLLSIDELGEVRGFSPALIERLRPLVTVHFGTGPFEPRHALPLAITAMLGDAGAADAIDRERELEGQRTAISTDSPPPVGLPITIIADATLPGGGHARRSALIELTGAPVRPYVIREFD